MKHIIARCFAAALLVGAAGEVRSQAEPSSFTAFKERVRTDPALLALARQAQAGVEGSRAAIPGLVTFTRNNPLNAEAWWLLGLAYANTDQQALSNNAAMRAAALKPELNEMTRHLLASGMMGGGAATGAVGAATGSQQGEARAAREAAPVASPRTQEPRAKAVFGRALPPRLPTGKYSCLHLYYDFMQKRMATNSIGMLTILSGDQYRWFDWATGRYAYDAQSGTVRWLSGVYASPSATTTVEWVEDRLMVKSAVPAAGKTVTHRCYLQS